MKANAFYKAQAKSIIKDMRDSKQLAYKELARLLETPDQPVDVQELINQVNDGAFSFALGLQFLAAMGVKSIEVPVPVRPRKDFKKHT